MNFRDEWATDKDGNHFVFTVEMKRRLYEAGLPVEVASLDQLEDVGPPARAEPRPQRSEAPEREEVIGPATIQIDPETGKYVGRLKWYNPARGYGFIAAAAKYLLPQVRRPWARRAWKKGGGCCDVGSQKGGSHRSRDLQGGWLHRTIFQNRSTVCI